MAVNVQSIFPANTANPKLLSSSKHILSTRLVPVLAQSQVSYSFSGSNRISFDINSRSDFVDFSNSYIRMNVTSTLNNDGVDDPNKYWAVGGAHSMFESIRISTQNGVELDKINLYNRYFAVMSGLTHSNEYVNKVGCRYGDSIGYESTDEMKFRNVTYVQSEATYTDTTSTLVLASTADLANALSEIVPGDVIRIETATTNATARCLTVVSDLSITIEGMPTANIAANAITSIQVCSKFSKDPLRKKMANTANAQVCFQIFSNLLRDSNLFPMFLLDQGLRVELTLCDPSQVLATTSKLGSTSGLTGANIVISNPQFLVQFCSPSDQLRSSYVDRFRSEGIPIQYVSMVPRLDLLTGGGSGQLNINFSSKAQSARMLILQQCNLRASTNTLGTADAGKSSYYCDSLAQGIKAKLYRLKCQAGSEVYPQSSPLELTDPFSTELQMEIERALEVTGVGVYARRMKPEEFHTFQIRDGAYDQGRATGRADALRMYIAIQLARDSSPLSGLDTSANPLQIQLEYNDTYSLTNFDGTSSELATRFVYSYLLYDTTMIINSSGCAVYY